MRKIDDGMRLSASELMRFKGCRHATTLDLRLIEIGDMKPGADGAEAELLQRQGDEHELAFLESLKAGGGVIVEIPKDGIPLEKSVRLTLEAIRSSVRSGAPAIRMPTCRSCPSSRTSSRRPANTMS